MSPRSPLARRSSRPGERRWLLLLLPVSAAQNAGHFHFLMTQFPLGAVGFARGRGYFQSPQPPTCSALCATAGFQPASPIQSCPFYHDLPQPGPEPFLGTEQGTSQALKGQRRMLGSDLVVSAGSDKMLTFSLPSRHHGSLPLPHGSLDFCETTRTTLQAPMQTRGCQQPWPGRFSASSFPVPDF